MKQLDDGLELPDLKLGDCTAMDLYRVAVTYEEVAQRAYRNARLFRAMAAEMERRALPIATVREVLSIDEIGAMERAGSRSCDSTTGSA